MLISVKQMSQQSSLVKAVLFPPIVMITEQGMLDFAKGRELMDILALALESVVMEKDAIREIFWRPQQLHLTQQTKEQLLLSVLLFYCVV